MDLYRWEEIEIEKLNPLVSRQVVHSERMTIARISLRQGAVVPEHNHENEQVTMLERGRLRFLMGGDEIYVSAGECLRIPPSLPHSVEALEDSVALDLFAPVREDWIRGDDAYLRR